MDESRKPGDSARAKYPWQNEPAPGENLGATGVFGAVPESSIDTGAGLVTKNDQDRGSGDGRVLPENAPQVQARGREGLQEPIVHKVVMGGGLAAAPIDLLELLRNNFPAAEDPGQGLQGSPLAAAFQAAPTPLGGSPPGRPSEGFTQLLRALSGDSLSASSVERPGAMRTAASSDSGGAAKEAGFTSLLGTLNPHDGSAEREERPEFPASPPRTAPSDGVGGFTALLQGFSGTGHNSSERQMNPRPLSENPGVMSPAIRLTPPMSTTVQPTPGAFTQLFSALAPEATNPAASEAEPTNLSSSDAPGMSSSPNPGSRSSGEEPSFTQLISAVGQPTSEASPYRDDRKSPREDFSSRPTPVREDMFASNQPPIETTDWSRPTAPPPQPESSSRSGGLTQLLRVLDESAKRPDAYPSAGETLAPSPTGGSLFTQTYKKLDELEESPLPVAPPTYMPSSRLSATQPYQSSVTEGLLGDSGPSNPMAPNLSSGPSDVTRILDASKLREMQRPRGSVGPVAINPLAVAQPVPAQPALSQHPALPQFQWQPPAPPTPAQWQPPQPGGAMQTLHYTPPAPTPQMPVPAAVPSPAAAPPAMGKMQQYLPLMAIIIIFLLVLILVTVVFLLKH